VDDLPVAFGDAVGVEGRAGGYLPGDGQRGHADAVRFQVGDERERGSMLLWRYQGDEQRLVRGAGRADPGAADDRASERLPRPLDERKPA
jgi:hypothetical protein